MSDFKVNLEELKKQIDTRKAEMNSTSVAMGRMPEGGKGKKGFLNELVSSMRSGANSTALEAIKAVNETVEARHGDPTLKGKQAPVKQPRQRVQVEENYERPLRSGADDWGVPGVTVPNRGNYGRGNYGGGYEGGEFERGDQLFEANIARQMAEFDRLKMSGNPVAAKIMETMQHQGQQPRYMNEQVVVETPQMFNEQTERNIEKLVESSFKNVLTTIYTKERIQESLVEYLQTDEGLKVIGRAINEIAKRGKAKK